jgi:E3 ubiquitin-protein ligase UBR1
VHNEHVPAILSLPDVPNPVRLDTMFLYHTRLWKKLRLSVKEVFASIVTLSHDHKLHIGRIPTLTS